MNRRQMVFLPGAALIASEAYAQSQSDAITKAPSPLLSTHKVMKEAAKYGRAKYAYKVPKTAAKQAKYLSFLTSLLSLTAAQEQQAASIFTAAIASRGALRTQVQAAHESLSAAVKNNDSGLISQASALIGTLGAQRRSLGAQANASFYQLLTPSQQAILAKFQSKNSAA